MGVPEECMGLCREKKDEENTVGRRSVQNVYPIDRCVQHKNHIQSCMYEEGNVQIKHTQWSNENTIFCKKN